MNTDDARFAEGVADRLRACFEPEADAARAAGAAAYMRNQFPFLGLPTPPRRRLAALVFRNLPTPSEGQLAATARALWRQPEREFQHTACDYLRAHIPVASASFIDVVEELVTCKSWWDTVDALAAHTAGPLVRDNPKLRTVMDTWAQSDNIWLARTAILHQLPFKEATDAERLYTYCRLRAPEREFFIRKAIGWALRQYAGTDPIGVAAFVEATPALSALSVREAMKGVERAHGSLNVPRRVP